MQKHQWGMDDVRFFMAFGTGDIVTLSSYQSLVINAIGHAKSSCYKSISFYGRYHARRDAYGICVDALDLAERSLDKIIRINFEYIVSLALYRRSMIQPQRIFKPSLGVS